MKTLHPAARHAVIAARHKHEADREALGDVVHGDRGGDEHAERFAASERDANADAFGERVNGHHRDDEQPGSRVGPAEDTEVQVLVLVAKPAARDFDERHPDKRAKHRPRDFDVRALPEQCSARTEHEACCDRVRDPEPRSAHLPEDQERQRTEARGERREGRGHKDRPGVHLHVRSIGSAVDGEHGKRT